MPTLIVDTCLAACQAAVVMDGAIAAGASEPMERGHQERLAPMVAEVMRAANLEFAELARIAVTLGPGSFTGLRVGLAFAKGVRLATGAAMAGLGVLPALAEAAGSGPVAAVVDARQGLAHIQVFDEGIARGPSRTLPVEAAAEALGALDGLTLAGPGAWLLAPRLPAAALCSQSHASLAALAALAARAADASELSPLYLRAPDVRLKSA